MVGCPFNRHAALVENSHINGIRKQLFICGCTMKIPVKVETSVAPRVTQSRDDFEAHLPAGAHQPAPTEQGLRDPRWQDVGGAVAPAAGNNGGEAEGTELGSGVDDTHDLEQR
ncbi:hypothetical protein Pelo_19048 [Pelomyxa schiedti]|nr:hypothetical protein Pelo_19048 [Pelomyxa schiedti]